MTVRAPRIRVTPALALLGTGAVSGTAFAALARGVAVHSTAQADGRARRRVPKRRRPHTKKAATAIGPFGKEFVHIPLALAVGVYLWRRGAGGRAAIPVLASVTSAAVSRVFERTLRQRKPPPGRHSPTEPSFPSGHSLETAAVALTTAYVFAREDLAHPSAAAAIGLATPLISGAARMYLDRHWLTDVVGGWLAGVSVAGLCSAVYEMTD